MKRRLLSLALGLSFCISFAAHGQGYQAPPTPLSGSPSLSPWALGMVPSNVYSAAHSVTGDPIVDAMPMPASVEVPDPSPAFPRIDPKDECSSMPSQRQYAICMNTETTLRGELSQRWSRTSAAARLDCQEKAKSRGFALYYTSLATCIISEGRALEQKQAQKEYNDRYGAHRGVPSRTVYPEQALEDGVSGYVQTSCAMTKGSDRLWRADACRVISSSGRKDFEQSVLDAMARSTWSDDQLPGTIDSSGNMVTTNTFSTN
ncbi:hypothetical protein QE368_000888 [Asaia bogorensis NBRC 16594]|nr:hypothetical protein [Asaia bogorensis NBRC 16594]